MKPFAELTGDELDAIESSLEAPCVDPRLVDGKFADGTVYDWDAALQATIETTPNGRRFVVVLRDGRLVRERELELPIAV
ncbi:MAG: hypothetical protein FJW32_07830 [Acidobacteria bacterium]|nr:hypothetical protein [Acidobacteriota bacterium]